MPVSGETGAPAAVELRGVARTFGRGASAHRVLAGVDLKLAAGETVAVLGPSGSGKSTLLRLVAGLDTPTAGTVLVDGEPVRDMARRAAVVFQDARLMAWRTLASNVAFGLPTGTPRAERRAAVAHWLDVVGLDGFGRHRPSQVSGGMAQRAALARALVRRPGVLLLDEPFAALDALTRLRMQDLLDEVRSAARTTVLLVTHDVDEALQLADRIVLLSSGPAAFISAVLDVPVPRPRERGDFALVPLRTDLLHRLGVGRTPAVPTSASLPHKEPLR
ncbi:ABC transporter ATP-binding protein [Streptomyces sp. NBC_00638]|uniref:ABC transporter ATP-binding protein n=1 Tax=unclassified Streptomyces TaxID=2593676 RepID=UPI00224E6371|nr:ABC transporter ATP-binding protein [Streptomyces sp. NBC_00638]MCX5008802.1 ABC transporter ATP-binding protein [Streptomyces sp. NBC_00638]